jgi:hypothetical protein
MKNLKNIVFCLFKAPQNIRKFLGTFKSYTLHSPIQLTYLLGDFSKVSTTFWKGFKLICNFLELVPGLLYGGEFERATMAEAGTRTLCLCVVQYRVSKHDHQEINSKCTLKILPNKGIVSPDWESCWWFPFTDKKNQKYPYIRNTVVFNLSPFSCRKW